MDMNFLFEFVKFVQFVAKKRPTAYARLGFEIPDVWVVGYGLGAPPSCSLHIHIAAMKWEVYESRRVRAGGKQIRCNDKAVAPYVKEKAPPLWGEEELVREDPTNQTLLVKPVISSKRITRENRGVLPALIHNGKQTSAIRSLAHSTPDELGSVAIHIVL